MSDDIRVYWVSDRDGYFVVLGDNPYFYYKDDDVLYYTSWRLSEIIGFSDLVYDSTDDAWIKLIGDNLVVPDMVDMHTVSNMWSYEDKEIMLIAYGSHIMYHNERTA